MPDDTKILMEFIKSGFDALGKSIDVLRDEVEKVAEKTEENGEKIAVFGERIKNVKDTVSGHIANHEKSKDRQLRKVALVTGVVSTAISSAALIFNWFSQKS